MKLREEGPILRLTQHNIFGYLFGLMFAGIGIFLLSTSGEMFVSLAFAISGVLIIFLVQREEVLVDQSTRNITISKKRLLTKKIQHVQFDSVATIEMRQEINHSSKGNSTTKYPLYVVLKDNSSLVLATESGKSGFLFFDHSKNERVIGNRIAQVIGVPFEERRTPTLGETLQTVRETIENQMNKNK